MGFIDDFVLPFCLEYLAIWRQGIMDNYYYIVMYFCSLKTKAGFIFSAVVESNSFASGG